MKTKPELSRHKIFYAFLSLGLLQAFGAAPPTFAQVPLNSSPAWSSTLFDDTWSTALGDMDGDGDLDLACGNWGYPTTVYLNNGRTLETKPSWLTERAYNTLSVAWGDVDRDGDLDLACGNLAEPNTIYRNNGGVLESTPYWSSQNSDNSASLAWGDVNGDGFLDLVCGNVESDGLGINGGKSYTLYLNMNGRLETTPSWSFVASELAFGVALGDMDGDGDLDLATSEGIFVNKDGLLVLAYYPKGRRVAWGDMDGDGDLDLVANNSYENYVFYNEGNDWVAKWSSEPMENIFSLAVGDVDGDGDLDVAAGGGNTSAGQPIVVYLNHDGVLEREPSWSSAPSYWSTSLAWGDMDGDGDLELLSSHRIRPATIYFNTSELFEAKPVWKPKKYVTSFSPRIVWGDFDNDGDQDLVYSYIDEIVIYMNNDGVLETAPFWLSDSLVLYLVASGDIDNDRDLDIVTPKGLYLNNLATGGRFTFSSLELNISRHLLLGDVDGDGNLDLVTSGQTYLNDGGTFQSSRSSPEGRTMALGDLDGDNDLDLVCTDSWYAHLVYLNNNGIFDNSPSLSAPRRFNRIVAIALGDVDGDGDLDLGCAYEYFRPNTLYLNQNGVFEPNPIWSSETAADTQNILWGDVDGDGDLDLVTSDGIYINYNGHPASTPIGPKAGSALADFDRDGDLDLATPGGLYVNQTNRKIRGKLANNWAFVRALKVIARDTIQNTLVLEYVLVDDENDHGRILAEYSLNGGGKWFKATEGPGSDGISGLKADAKGIRHTFVWDLEADKVQGANVVFRLRVFSSVEHAGPIQRPFTSYQLPIGLIDNKPNLALLSPAENDRIGGKIPLIGKAWDATNFDRYEIEVDGNLVYQSRQAQPQTTVLFPLDASLLPAGPHTLTLKAFDKKNNQRTMSRQVTTAALPQTPQVILKYPTDYEAEVALNSPIIAQFNSKMNPVSLTSQTLVIRDASNQPVAGNVAYNYHTSTLTFVPGAPLRRNGFYYATLDQAFQNEASAPLGANTVWAFLTEDNAVPFDIIKTQPANGAVGVAVSDSIKITLALNSPYRQVSLQELGGNVENLTASEVSRPFDQEIDLIIKPKVILLGGTLYLVTLSAGQIEPPAKKFSFYFITKDVKEPFVNTFSPENGSMVSPLNFEISATFNKAMNPNTLDSTTVFLAQAGVKMPSIITYSVQTQKVLITPRQELAPNTTYAVTIKGAVQSRGGLALRSDLTWQFHTASMIGAAGGIARSPDGLVEMVFPPNAVTDHSAIIIQKMAGDLAEFLPSDPLLRLLTVPYRFASDPVKETFEKPVTLRMKGVLGDSLFNIAEKKLAIFAQHGTNRKWTRVGGAVSKAANTVSAVAAIQRLERYYAILEDQSVQIAGRNLSLTNVTSQPRVFSPQGGGFNTQTAISFDLGKESNVTIKIYNAAGRLVRVLTENESMPYGTQVKSWDGKDQSGHYCLSGLHLVTIQAEDKMVTKTVVVLNK